VRRLYRAPEIPGKLRYYSYRLPNLVFCRSSSWRRPSLISQLTAFILSPLGWDFSPAIAALGMFQMTHQALLLLNWVAGFAGLVGFDTLYFGRQGRANDVGNFWRQLAPTWRGPVGLSVDTLKRSRLICGTAKSTWSQKPQSRAISATCGKKRLSGLSTPRSIYCRRGERPVISMRVR
jgi:hypothetical protein